MRYRYCVLFVIMLLFLTGCKFEYNLVIDANSIKENSIIYNSGSTKDSIKEDVFSIMDKYTGMTNDYRWMPYTIVNKNNTYGLSLDEEYSILDYQNSDVFSQCYDSYKIVKSENSIIISTGNKFNCFDYYKELEDVTVNLTTDLKVISSNADKVNNKTYTWNINRNNKENINIKLSTANESSSGNNTDNNSQNTNKSNGMHFSAFELVSLFILIIGIVFFVIRRIGNKKNEF